MKRHSVLIIVFIVLALLLVACSSPEAQQPSSDNARLTGKTVELDVEAKQWEFTPDTITVNKNDRVILHITSVDVTHGFALDAYDIRESLDPGITVTVDFIANKAGECPFYCSVFCGQGHGQMRGKLVVKE